MFLGTLEFHGDLLQLFFAILERGYVDAHAYGAAIGGAPLEGLGPAPVGKLIGRGDAGVAELL